MSEELKLEGKLSVWIEARNFGFICVNHSDNSVERIFLHKSRIVKGTAGVGAIVRFTVNPIQEGERRSAIDAEIVTAVQK